MPVKVELRIPDLWFDFYARFLPGIAFVAAIRTLVVGNVKIPNAAELLVLAFGGFLFALISQPISSRLTKGVEYLAAKTLKKEVEYVADVQRELGRSKRESMILSKMHGEVTFFCQLSVLSFAFQVIQATFPEPEHPWTLWMIVIAFVFIILAFEVAARRVQKAKKYSSDGNDTG